MNTATSSMQNPLTVSNTVDFNGRLTISSDSFTLGKGKYFEKLDLDANSTPIFSVNTGDFSEAKCYIVNDNIHPFTFTLLLQLDDYGFDRRQRDPQNTNVVIYPDQMKVLELDTLAKNVGFSFMGGDTPRYCNAYLCAKY